MTPASWLTSQIQCEWCGALIAQRSGLLCANFGQERGAGILRLRSSASRRRFEGRIRARRARSSFRATHSTPGVSIAAAARGCSERDTEIIVLSSFSLVKPKERPSLSSLRLSLSFVLCIWLVSFLFRAPCRILRIVGRIFAQLSLPPEISFPGSWASVQPQDATIAAQGLGSQLGGTPETPTLAGGSADSLSTKGKKHVATAPALCISLAMHGGTFLSPADSLVCLGQEEVRAFLAVVHMALTANTKTQPWFLIVLGAPSVSRCR